MVTVVSDDLVTNGVDESELKEEPEAVTDEEDVNESWRDSYAEIDEDGDMGGVPDLSGDVETETVGEFDDEIETSEERLAKTLSDTIDVWLVVASIVSDAKDVIVADNDGKTDCVTINEKVSGKFVTVGVPELSEEKTALDVLSSKVGDIIAVVVSRAVNVTLPVEEVLTDPDSNNDFVKIGVLVESIVNVWLTDVVIIAEDETVGLGDKVTCGVFDCVLVTIEEKLLAGVIVTTPAVAVINDVEEPLKIEVTDVLSVTNFVADIPGELDTRLVNEFELEYDVVMVFVPWTVPDIILVRVESTIVNVAVVDGDFVEDKELIVVLLFTKDCEIRGESEAMLDWNVLELAVFDISIEDVSDCEIRIDRDATFDCVTEAVDFIVFDKREVADSENDAIPREIVLSTDFDGNLDESAETVEESIALFDREGINVVEKTPLKVARPVVEEEKVG